MHRQRHLQQDEAQHGVRGRAVAEVEAEPTPLEPGPLGLDGEQLVAGRREGDHGVLRSPVRGDHGEALPREQQLVLVREEGAELSVYRVQAGPRQVEFRFQPKAERHLPTALASMAAKYLRELAMRPFNAFWQRHIPGLRHTAGYPGDSHRFFAEIRAVKEQLGIADGLLWRER